MSQTLTPEEGMPMQIEITAGKLIEHLNSTKRAPKTESPIHHWETIEDKSYLVLHNAKIIGHLRLRDDILNYKNLKIVNCHFSGMTTFQNLKINSLIVDSKFSNTFDISGGQYASITFSGGQYENQVNLKDINVSGDCEFNGGTFKKDLAVANCEFTNNVKFSGGIFEKVQIGSGTFKEGLIITSIEVNKKFTFMNGEYEKPVYVYSGNYKEGISLLGGIFHDGLYILGGHHQGKTSISGGEYLKRVVIKDGKFDDNFTLSGGTFGDGFMITGGSFKKEVILSGGKFSGDISIIEDKNTLSLNSIDLSIREPNLAVTLEGLTLNSIRLFGLSMIQKLRLVNINLTDTKSSLTIENTSLNNTELIGCDFQDANLTVDNSNLLGLFYTDTLFPEHVKSSESDDQKNLEQVRDTYSQLKTVAEKQNDRQSSLYFQSKANDKLFSLANSKLTSKKGKWLNYFNPFREGWGEFFQLLLNKCSNDFGQSYLRALVVFVILTIPLYVLYILVISPEISMGLDCVYTWKVITIYWGDYFQFINPLRPVDFLHKKIGCISPSGGVGVIDWTSRVVIFYLSYQFVQAFRKYGRR